MTRRCALGVSVLLAVSLLAVGCGVQSGTAPTDQQDAVAPTAPVAPSVRPVSALPDSVPLPPKAELAEETKSFSGEGARGWTAVVLTPAGTPLTATASQLTSDVQRAGWTATLSGTERDGYVIASTKAIGAQSAWLNINVTTPVPGSGPAVTYRYAIGQVPTVSASP